MYERFDEPARRALESAFDEARALGHGQVGTEHLLLGLLTVTDTGAARSLVTSGATLEGCRAKVAEASVGKQVGGAPQDLPLTDRATRALERAGRLSLRRRSPTVSSDHVLLSILDVEGTAGQVLRGLSVDLTGLRGSLPSADEGAPPGPEPEREPGPVARPEPQPQPEPEAEPAAGGLPCCPHCRTSLDSVLAHRPVTSRSQDGGTAAWIVAYCSSCGTAIGATAGRVRAAR